MKLYDRLIPAVTLLCALMITSVASAASEERDPREPEGPWLDLKQRYFGNREIRDGKGVVGLEAPHRAEDAAIVPISITDRLSPDDERRIDKLWLFIDRNPVPMSAEFEFGPAAGNASLATRVRVDAYTHMRVIVETSDDELYMTTRFVKASGGCSAPASKDPEAVQANLGKMRLRSLGSEVAPSGEPRLAQLLVRHPNHSGLQMNQLTRLRIPAHFINAIDINYAGEPVINAKMTFSLSENPSLRFYYKPEQPGTLRVTVRDTEQNRFTESLEPEFGIARASGR